VNLALTSLPDLVQQSAAHAWLFIPSAMLLGALHGLDRERRAAAAHQHRTRQLRGLEVYFIR
jgi:hypothetical protein